MVKCQIEFNMYGKILHGSSFGGLVNYVNDSRKNATLVAASDGINLTNNQTITDSFVMHAGLSCRTKKPVAHFVLAFSPHDAPRINNAILGQLSMIICKEWDMMITSLLHFVITIRSILMFT